jgi:hypothetical protein
MDSSTPSIDPKQYRNFMMIDFQTHIYWTFPSQIGPKNRSLSSKAKVKFSLCVTKHHTIKIYLLLN